MKSLLRGVAVASLLTLAGCAGQRTAPATTSYLNVDGISVVIQDGRPAEVSVDVQGSLPNGCYRLGPITQVHEGNSIQITIPSVNQADRQACTQTIQQVHQAIVLTDRLPPGTYTLQVNESATSFTINGEAAGILPSNPGTGNSVPGGLSQGHPPLPTPDTSLGNPPDPNTGVRGLPYPDTNFHPGSQPPNLPLPTLPPGVVVSPPNNGIPPLTLPPDGAQPPPAPSLSNSNPFTFEIQVDAVEINVAESMPPQITAHISGVIGNGCTAFDSITQERNGNDITIHVIGKNTGAQMCTMLALMLDENVRLEGDFPAGEYTVHVNQVTRTFKI